jgi:hypothetical protein
MRQLSFNSLHIKRAIIHKILERKPQDACSLVKENNVIISFTPKMTLMLIDRLVDAMGRKGKGFYLEIWDVAPSSFFLTCHDLIRKSDTEFISASNHLATKLAGLQTQEIIPDSYLLFIEAIDKTYNNGSPVYIAIKTEPHAAFKQTGDIVEILDDLFLSPSQKLYKVGILFEDSNPDQAFPNSDYSGYLFDDQFGGKSNLAKYFYESFLGFSAKHNGALQTKYFYDLTHSLIMSKAPIEDRENLLDALRVTFAADVSPTIRPNEFGEHYIQDQSFKGQFTVNVVNKLPGSFLRDTSLIDTTLKSKKVNFGAFSITGPNEEFASKVKQIKTKEELESIDITNPNITVIVMPGKPNVRKPNKPKAKKPNGHQRAGTAS